MHAVKEATSANLSIGNRVQEHATSEAEVSRRREFSQSMKEMEEDLLGNGLEARRDVEVGLFEGCMSISFGYVEQCREHLVAVTRTKHHGSPMCFVATVGQQPNETVKHPCESRRISQR